MALPAAATTAAASTAPDSSRGKQIYLQTCASCHGPDGNKVAGMDLKSLRSRMTAEQLTRFILSPVPPMPKLFPEPRTPADERDIRDVAAYVVAWPP